MNDEEIGEILERFHCVTRFADRSGEWDRDKKELFCRTVRAIHGTGLDLYGISSGRIRFGVKNPKYDEACCVAGYIGVANNAVQVSSNTANEYWVFGEIDSITSEFSALDDNSVQRIESELENWSGIPNCRDRQDRAGLWPDDYANDALGDGQDNGPGSGTCPVHSLNTILYGPPGTGKTHATFSRCVELCDGATAPANEKEVRDRYRELIRDGRIEFVTFHQSYGYEEFVEGLRPRTDGDGGAGFRLASEDGVLKRIAKQAQNNRTKSHVLVIDEINRGNLSKVFGEAITLVEKDKREGKKNEIAVTLPHSRERFTLPHNLHILGTMNTADRSIALLDTALRRRFDFVELPPKPELLEGAKKNSGIDLPAALNAMNERLEWLLGRDHLIGHAWLMNADGREDVDNIMRRKIIPMLAEYFHEDWSRVRAVLGGGDGFIKSEALNVPPGLDDDDEDRFRWSVREEFEDAAYHQLTHGAAPNDAADGDGAKDDGG